VGVCIYEGKRGKEIGKNVGWGFPRIAQQKEPSCIGKKEKGGDRGEHCKEKKKVFQGVGVGVGSLKASSWANQLLGYKNGWVGRGDGGNLKESKKKLVHGDRKRVDHRTTQVPPREKKRRSGEG